MARKPDPYLIDDDNPELTDEELASARPASEVLPPALYATLVPGAPDSAAADGTVTVRLTLDQRVVQAFKESGPGWQRRMNDTLKKAVGL